MKILFVSPFLPEPPDEGGRRRVSHLLRELASRHEVRLVAFQRAGEAAPATGPVPTVAVSFTEIPPSFGRRLRRFFSPLPDLAAKHRRPELRAALVAEVENHRPDLIWVEESPLAVNLPAFRIPVVIDEQNIESNLWKAGCDWRDRFELNRLRQYETAVWNRSAGVAAVSAEDEAAIKARAPRTPTVILENGVDTAHFQPGRTPDGPVLLAGTLHHPPNREAIEWFLAELWPKLRERRPGTTALIAGKYTEELRGTLPAGVTAGGYFADIRDAYRQSSLLLVPLQRGGGSRLKILEAWAAGLPVVSTATGAAGLRGAAEHCRLADQPEKLVDAVLGLLDHRAESEALAARARDHAVREYDWSKTLAPVHDFLNRVGANNVSAR